MTSQTPVGRIGLAMNEITTPQATCGHEEDRPYLGVGRSVPKRAPCDSPRWRWGLFAQSLFLFCLAGCQYPPTFDKPSQITEIPKGGSFIFGYFTVVPERPIYYHYLNAVDRTTGKLAGSFCFGVSRTLWHDCWRPGDYAFVDISTTSSGAVQSYPLRAEFSIPNEAKILYLGNINMFVSDKSTSPTVSDPFNTAISRVTITDNFDTALSDFRRLYPLLKAPVEKQIIQLKKR